jgi:hypothetical protein
MQIPFGVKVPALNQPSAEGKCAKGEGLLLQFAGTKKAAGFQPLLKYSSGPVSAPSPLKVLHRRPGCDEKSERTDVFARALFAKKKVKRQHH